MKQKWGLATSFAFQITTGVSPEVIHCQSPLCVKTIYQLLKSHWFYKTSFSILLLYLFIVLLVCVCMHVAGRGKLTELISFYYVVFRDQAEVVRCGGEGFTWWTISLVLVFSIFSEYRWNTNDMSCFNLMLCSSPWEFCPFLSGDKGRGEEEGIDRRRWRRGWRRNRSRYVKLMKKCYLNKIKFKKEITNRNVYLLLPLEKKKSTI